MTFRCKNKCVGYGGKGRAQYKDGYKRCKECTVFLKYEGIFCPCCGCRLKRKPITAFRKRMYDEAMGVVRY